jgi:hypothetical protein
MPARAKEESTALDVFRIGRKEEDRDMGIHSMRSALGLLTAAALVAGSTAAWAASDRSGKFSPRNWPEETIYKPECRSVQADGTWLSCIPADRDW